jgi:hypothetical protein
VSTGNRTCLTWQFIPTKQGFSVIFATGFALDTEDALAYDGPVLKRFYDEFGPRLSSMRQETFVADPLLMIA